MRASNERCQVSIILCDHSTEIWHFWICYIPKEAKKRLCIHQLTEIGLIQSYTELIRTLQQHLGDHFSEKWERELTIYSYGIIAVLCVSFIIMVQLPYYLSLSFWMRDRRIGANNYKNRPKEKWSTIYKKKTDPHQTNCGKISNNETFMHVLHFLFFHSHTIWSI